MSFFGKVFGSDAAIDKVIGHGKELLDDAFYTDEEKAADRAQAARETRGLVNEWIKNSQGQNLARRVLALSIGFVWLSLFLIATLLDLAGVFVDMPTAVDAGQVVYNKFSQASQIIDKRNDQMTGAIMLILGFYFAAPKISEIANTAMQKIAKK